MSTTTIVSNSATILQEDGRMVLTILSSNTAAGVLAEKTQQALDAIDSAADTAMFTAGMYPNTALGLAGTVDGEYFSIPSPEADEFSILYQNVSGSAVEKKRFGTAAMSQAAIDAATAAADSETAAAGSASAAATSAGLADADRIAAEAARDATFAAAQASGVYMYDTKAAANAAVAGLPDLTIVEVLADESQSGARTRYRKESGSYVLKIQYPYNVMKAITLAEVMSKTVTGESLVINCYGDSMTYGQDTVSSTGDLQPGINGSSATRALYQYPEALGAAMTKAGFSVTVNNYGFPGDTAVQGKTRFPSAVACDIAIVMFGHNDANDVSGSPATSPADFKAAMDYIIRREQAKGAFVILLTPPRLKQSNLSGAVVNRQRWMRVHEATTKQLAEQFSIPVVSVDELVGHRGAEIYSDDVHFNKYGYNEWGWNLAAILAQRSDMPKRISHGTVIQAAGSSITGAQTLLNGKTVLVATPAVPLCVSGYFEEDVVAQVYISYNAGVGGAQRAKITLGGGTRNNSVQKMRTVTVNAAPGKILNSDVIKKGYRTFFIEVASSTTSLYIDRVEFVRPQRVFTDTAYEFVKVSALQGLSLPIAFEINRWVIDDSMPLEGDFILDVDITTAPTVGSAAGVSLVSEFNEADGVPNRFVSLIRLGLNAGFSRVATGTNDDTSYTNAFPTAATVIRIIRSGDSIELYGNGVLLATKTVTFKRLLPAIFRNNSEITVNRYIVK